MAVRHNRTQTAAVQEPSISISVKGVFLACRQVKRGNKTKLYKNAKVIGMECAHDSKQSVKSHVMKVT